jgi:hypothetical protein
LKPGSNDSVRLAALMEQHAGENYELHAEHITPRMSAR